MKNASAQEVPNLHLKFLLLSRYGTQVAAARDLRIKEKRLSQIIHRRIRPRPAEARRISWKLQLPVKQIFGDDNGA